MLMNNASRPMNCKLTYDIIKVILNYVDLQDILLKFLRISKSINKFVKQENYLLYKKFLQLFCINQIRKRNAVPAYNNVINLIKECLYAIEEQENTGIDA